MRHSTWQYLIGWTSRMGNKYGGTVYDSETGKTWDWGQAICREMYGPDWMKSEHFHRDEEIPPDEPAPRNNVKRCKEWEAGDWPDWVDRDLTVKGVY